MSAARTGRGTDEARQRGRRLFAVLSFAAMSFTAMSWGAGARAAEDAAPVTPSAPAAEESMTPGGASSPSPAAEDTARERVTMALGRTIEIDGGRLVAGIVAIDDQRCPMSLRCRWPGNAWLMLRLMTQAGEKAEVRLDTTGDSRAASFAGYTLTLEALEPYPQVDAPIPGDAYRATVMIRRD